jgi:hypothetical protein
VLRKRGGAVECQDFRAIDSLRAEVTAFAQTIAGGYRMDDGAGMIATVHALEAIIQSIATEETIVLG